MDGEVKPHFISEFDAVVADWNHKPAFAARKYISGDSIEVAVYAQGEHSNIWNWVNRGTRGPYPITPRHAPLLVFQTGYIPRTSPGGGYGGAGRATGPTVRAKEVMHPGIAARKFHEHIARKNKVWFSRTMENIWRWAIRRL